MNGKDEGRAASTGFYTRLGFGTVAAVLFGLTTWSISAPIDGAVIAPGRIVVEGNRKIVQHLEGGIVGAIEVREGDAVAAGEVVARLEDTVQQANASLIENQLMALYAKRARLEAERDNADALRAPRGAADILKSPLFEGKISGQRNLFKARRNTFHTQRSLLNERIVQQRERISGFEAQKRSLRDQFLLISDELESIRALHDDGYAPTTQLREVEREAKRLAGSEGAITARIAEAESAVAEASLEAERLEEARREEAIAELRDIDASIAEYEERRITALDALRRTEIRSPQAGRVLSLSVHTVGGVISPGVPLMEIVPDSGKLQIEARIAPKDIDKIKPHQETLIRFTALGGGRSPEAYGEVKAVSADVIADDLSGVNYYLVSVDLPADRELETVLAGNQLVPGMPVEAFIRTGSRPAISYFMKPLTDAFARSMRED